MSRWLVLVFLAVGSLAEATPSGKKWALSACSATVSCPANMQCAANRCVPLFRIATTIQNTGATVLNGAQKVPYATVISRMGEAFQNWTSDRVTACDTAWGSVFAGTFSAPSGTEAINPTDGQNSLIWLGGPYWRYSSLTLALTTNTFITASGQLIDADMELNNNLDWSNTAAPNTYDFESVVLHEAGHFLGLDHTPANALAVMYPVVPLGSTKRVLASADTADVCTVYPGDTGGQGVTCTVGTQCTGSRVCEGAIDGSSKMCTANCTGPADDSCPTGYSCQSSSAGYACLTQVGASDLCRFCTTGSNCNSGVCVTDRTALWCSISCSSTAQCGTGYTCDPSHFCVPKTSCSMQCTGGNASECAVGFTCQSGTCRPSGNVGERCEVLGVCNACIACVADATDPSLAFCRACCGGAATDGFCNSCTGTTCNANQACVGLANGKDQVCIPSSGGSACQTCNNTNAPCQTGLVCTAGRCHAPCNPFAPANCAACFDLGGGTGQCSCDDEVAHVGDPCGQTATSLNACDNGLLCVPSPTPYCRVPCTITDPMACRVGETCTSLSGKTVCLPSSAGNQCTSCAAGNTCLNSQFSCYGNRCYLTCNINSSGRCATCVQVDANGNGVCACDDQIVESGANCGLPTIASCQPGTLCVESICRGQCDPKVAASTCPAGSQCRPFANAHYCLPPTNQGGGQGGGTGGGELGGGTGGGGFTGIKDGGEGTDSTKNPPVCGCSVTQASLLGPLMLLAFIWRRKPRDA